MKTTVVIPTYQESQSIERMLDDVRAHLPDASILIVDDGSPDGTADLVDQRAAVDPRVAVLRRTEKNGLGPAYRAGFERALADGAEIIVQMDADGSHRGADLPALVAATEQADLVIGSRWVPGGTVVNWPFVRKFISRGGTTYARLMLGVPIHDVTAGFRAWRGGALRAVDFSTTATQGYCFQIDMARRAVDQGLRVSEVPITFIERETGQSKMSGSIVREALWRVTVWGVQRLFRR